MFSKCMCLVPLVVFVIVANISDIGGSDCNCPTITPRRGVALTCKNSQGVTIDCSSPAQPLTTITYTCDQFFRPALRRSPAHRQLQCSKDCTWQNMKRLEEYKCEIDCGKPFQPHIPYIARGQKTLRYSWPWHATIFLKDARTMENHYICGGTLISEHVVLTAAHCLITAKQHPLEFYQIVLGAISSNWSENTADPHAQFFKISQSYVPEEYDRVEQISDIALVELDKSIVPSEAVSPACFPYEDDFAKPQEPVVDGEGEVVGFGRNEHGEYERYLKYTRLPILGAPKCYEILQNRQGIDKFCAGVVNGSAVCIGDSGSGMVFKGPGLSRYYVQGVVSHGLHTRGKVTCDGPSYFSNVLYFTKWVAKIVDKIEEKSERVSEGTTSTPKSVSAVQANDFADKNGECTEILMEEGVDITCTHQGHRTSCLNAPNGTITAYACKYGYQSESYTTTERVCRHGIWTMRRHKCVLQCGIGRKEYSPFINANLTSKSSKWPWIVALYQENPPGSGKFEYFCEGSLISGRAVLTASHCVTVSLTNEKRRDIIMASIGEFNRTYGANYPEVQIKRVTHIDIQGQYNVQFYENDIAIAWLESNVEISDRVWPVCVPHYEVGIEPGLLGTLAGWRTDNSEQIQEIQLPIVSSKTCRDSHKSLESLNRRTTFCAGFQNAPSSCDGDSGGGFFFEDRGKWFIQGIVSADIQLRTGVCVQQHYTVFTRVDQYMSWIKGLLERKDLAPR